MVKGQLLNKSIKVLLFLLLFMTALYYGKPFLVPVVIAALLAMLLLPLSEKLQRIGWSKGLSILSCILVLILLVGIIIGLLSWQVSDMAKDAPKIEQNVTQRIQQVRQKITTSLGIPPQKQEQIVKEQQQSGTSKISGMISGAFTSFAGVLTNFILILVYVFLFLFYRYHLKTFLLKIVAKEDQENARQIVQDCKKVAQKYLTGLALMISALWIMYSIGFTIAGVNNGIFFAVLCGLLEIVPFIGNLVGVILTAFMSMAQGGSTGMLIGILVTYAIVQFIQTYILETLVVGRGVNINPLFTITGLVVGELIWGIAGMVLAIPMLAITKIICDHIAPLKPYGALIGENKKEGST
ncbi:MAG TPA: AI-2E family transporter, partial [Flavisolibacter sp.]|nr:AI-2E family transporter [Flavisolibacter sp.]